MRVKHPWSKDYDFIKEFAPMTKVMSEIIKYGGAVLEEFIVHGEWYINSSPPPSSKELHQMFIVKITDKEYTCEQCKHKCTSYNGGKTFAVNAVSQIDGTFIFLDNKEYAPCGERFESGLAVRQFKI
ncbi:MAG TPA: hypothetical protein VFD17_01450 [Clostridia bacterium]|nr:hypothetical protein [Clostridia bacterium]